MVLNKEKMTSIISHNQSGGITAHTVNVGKPERPERRTEDFDINQLKSVIPCNAKVILCAVIGDLEAFNFSQKVLPWLKNNGYNNIEGVNNVIRTPPAVGQVIDKISENEFRITICANQ